MSLTVDKEWVSGRSEVWEAYCENDATLSVLAEEVDYLWLLNLVGDPDEITSRAKVALISTELMTAEDIFEFCYSCIDHCLSTWEEQNPGQTWLSDAKTTLRNWIDGTGGVTDKDLKESWPGNFDVANSPRRYAWSVMAVAAKTMGAEEFDWQVATLKTMLES